MEKRQPLQQMLLAKVIICLQETETRSMPLMWIKDLNIRPETMRLVQERAGKTLEAIGICKVFLSRAQAAQ
jgi:hypothetical protein